jgi:7-carboxy-7-deazaguanine synthase
VALVVNEIFYSIQGESSYSGCPCVFVRLTGCNLRCSYCDTQYAYEDGESLEVPEILERVKAHRCHLVEVTGGEPLIQEETPLLVSRLLQEGFTVLLETNGSLDIGRVDPRCVRVVDIKCPSSGQMDCNDLRNLDRLSDRDELKFVIGARDDYEYAKHVLGRMRYPIGAGRVNFSPVFGGLDSRILAAWILEDHLEVRLNLQLHKIIWGSEQRGV